MAAQRLHAIPAQGFQRSDAGARSALQHHTTATRYMARQGRDQRTGAAGVVQHGQQQRHGEQPAQRYAAGRQYQGFPERMAVAGGAPAHQGQPSQRAQRSEQQFYGLEAHLKPRRQAQDVDQRLSRYAAVHGCVDHPHGQRCQAEKEHRKPVDCCSGAALQRGQGKCGQHGQAGQGEHQHAVVAVHEHERTTAHGHHAQRDRDVPMVPMVTPAPQRPQYQWPSGPGEPHQRPAHGPKAGQRAWPIQAPAPGIGPGGQASSHRQGEQQPRTQTTHLWIVGESPHQPPRRTQRQGQRGGSAERQCDHSQPSHPTGDGGAKRRRRQSPQQRGHFAELHQLGRGFMPQLQQAQAGDQGQQGAVSQGAGVVHRMGLAPESETHRLRRFRACQVKGGIPNTRQSGQQQQRKRQAGGQRWVDPRTQCLDEHCAQPVRQQRAIGGQTAQHRRQPRRAPLRHGQHVGVGGEVGIAPWIAANHAGQDIGRAQQPQRPTGQRLGCTMGHECGGGQVHGSHGPTNSTGEKKGSRGCLLAQVGSTCHRPHFLIVRCANLLRNFSTRPPSVSTLFCWPV